MAAPVLAGLALGALFGSVGGAVLGPKEEPIWKKMLVGGALGAVGGSGVGAATAAGPAGTAGTAGTVGTAGTTAGTTSGLGSAGLSAAHPASAANFAAPNVLTANPSSLQIANAFQSAGTPITSVYAPGATASPGALGAIETAESYVGPMGEFVARNPKASALVGLGLADMALPGGPSELERGAGRTIVGGDPRLWEERRKRRGRQSGPYQYTGGIGRSSFA